MGIEINVLLNIIYNVLNIYFYKILLIMYLYVLYIMNFNKRNLLEMKGWLIFGIFLFQKVNIIEKKVSLVFIYFLFFIFVNVVKILFSVSKNGLQVFGIGIKMIQFCWNICYYFYRY